MCISCAFSCLLATFLCVCKHFLQFTALNYSQGSRGWDVRDAWLVLQKNGWLSASSNSLSGKLYQTLNKQGAFPPPSDSRYRLCSKRTFIVLETKYPFEGELKEVRCTYSSTNSYRIKALLSAANSSFITSSHQHTEVTLGHQKDSRTRRETRPV